jgi:hypothetical protein
MGQRAGAAWKESVPKGLSEEQKAEIRKQKTERSDLK